MHLSAIIAGRTFLVGIRVAREGTFRSIIDTRGAEDVPPSLLDAMRGGDVGEIRIYVDISVGVEVRTPASNLQQQRAG